MFGRSRAPRNDDGLAVAILRLLEEQMGTGLDVTQRLEQRFEGRLDISAGEVYPLLQYLEDRGFVAQEPVGNGKVYHVTEAGFAFLAEQASQQQRPESDEDFVRERGRGRERHGWGHHGHHHWHHHHHSFGWEGRHALVGLIHELKHVGRSIKHAFRHGQLDQHRLERVRAIVERARHEIEAMLRERGPQAL